MTFESIESVEAYLDQIPRFQNAGAAATDFKLSRFENFCGDIGDPQLAFPAIHVAGTNGKGSTCRILGSVYREAGFKVGVYTSPHLRCFEERFQINGSMIPESALLRFFRKQVSKIEEHRLTYFEISTAIAFWWFAESEVDLAVVEVGLGGRLDATNLVSPVACAITSISLDHTDILGDTIREIAREKGGIIKSGVPVITGDLPEEARHELSRIAEKKGSWYITIDDLKPTAPRPGEYRLAVEEKELIFKSTLGAAVQAKNIAVSWQLVQCLQNSFKVSLDDFREGIRKADAGPGRFERLLDDRHWYFDGGHNLEAVVALKDSLKGIAAIEKWILVLTLMKDKIRPEVMEEFSEFPNIHYYELNVERAASFADIKRWLPQANLFPDGRSQELLSRQFNSELVIFAGSFYFYDTVRDWVQSFEKP